MSKHVIDDAGRCLQCRQPMCAQGCPVHTPIRDAIRLLLNGETAEAGRLLFENNPLSIVCCHVCPQENQCEGSCVMGRTGSPVQISAIEQYISDYYLNVCSPQRRTGEAGRVAIIGSGPAGITIAFLLLRLNYAVTIYEGSDRIGGVLRYGIPEFRLPKSYLDRLAALLLDFGARIRPNTTIGANLTVDDLFRDGFDAVFIGTGVWKPQRINLPGESLGNVHYAIEYLRNPDAYTLGRSLAVIGAGNVAMDVARTAVRHGCRDVAILCNKGEQAVTARKAEVDYARIDGARLLLNKTAVSFCEQGVRLVETPPDGEKIDARESALFPAESVIIAIGQTPRAVIVSSTNGIDINKSGLVSVDDEGRTTRAGVFASGDVVTGAKTVVEAVRVSKRVAAAIDAYVRQKAAAGAICGETICCS
ncbi:MAG: NAD(P)-dependent oxidoreductase [Oscillospiraceae bacterium]|nr:NAD(P)-dependent oxidoreductase [Oscillospiraceae bacterium]